MSPMETRASLFALCMALIILVTRYALQMRHKDDFKDVTKLKRRKK